MFDKAQIMEFKDAFSIMDTNGDGVVDINDLKVTFERLGKIRRFIALVDRQDNSPNKKGNLLQHKRLKLC